MYLIWAAGTIPAPAGAAKTEARLARESDDAGLRLQLLSFYASHPAESGKASRAAHIHWIIENDPHDLLGLAQVATGVYRLRCEGDDLADPAAAKRTGELWLDQVNKNPTTVCYARFEMKLPNGERAIVDRRKLEEYCLNKHHPRGRNKARVFASAGIGQAETEALRKALLEAALNLEAVRGGPSPYGQRYTVDFDLAGPARTVRIGSTWIVRNGEDLPRLTSCFVI